MIGREERKLAPLPSGPARNRYLFVSIPSPVFVTVSILTAASTVRGFVTIFPNSSVVRLCSLSSHSSTFPYSRRPRFPSHHVRIHVPNLNPLAFSQPLTSTLDVINNGNRSLGSSSHWKIHSFPSRLKSQGVPIIVPCCLNSLGVRPVSFLKRLLK